MILFSLVLRLCCSLLLHLWPFSPWQESANMLLHKESILVWLLWNGILSKSIQRISCRCPTMIILKILFPALLSSTQMMSLKSFLMPIWTNCQRVPRLAQSASLKLSLVEFLLESFWAVTQLSSLNLWHCEYWYLYQNIQQFTLKNSEWWNSNGSWYHAFGNLFCIGSQYIHTNLIGNIGGNESGKWTCCLVPKSPGRVSNSLIHVKVHI